MTIISGALRKVPPVAARAGAADASPSPGDLSYYHILQYNIS